MRAGRPARAVLDAKVVPSLADPPRFSERSRFACPLLLGRYVSSRDFLSRYFSSRLLLKDRHGEAGAAFAAAVGEDLLAAARGHASAETMLAHAANVVGLVGAFHLGSAKRAPKAAIVKDNEAAPTF
jgi:hypothetical protein